MGWVLSPAAAEVQDLEARAIHSAPDGKVIGLGSGLGLGYERGGRENLVAGLVIHHGEVPCRDLAIRVRVRVRVRCSLLK
jgi:hypothetical protein